ncbi:hypothetical protein Patl1_35413 [Pistacia atlantica]|nr:hypothetical protein Patl1_35413 [Pistacia atlantica]
MSELCPIRPVGPLVPTSLLGEDEKFDVGVELWTPENACLEWLNKQAVSSVIYLSFGSIIVFSAKQMEVIATALKNSNHPFLWVAKQPEVPTPNETIVAGVPVIAYPQWTDQPTNAKLATDVFKIGVRMRPNSDGIVSTEEVGKCIKEIISGPKSEEYKKNLTELKVAARKAVAVGGSSDMNIQWFFDEISNGNSCESEGLLNDRQREEEDEVRT